MIKKLQIVWHTLQLKYKRLTLDGCRDEEIKDQIINKLEYHSTKLNELNKNS